MNGLGNRFAIIDARKEPVSLTTDQIIKLGNPQGGIGFDQLLIIEPSATCDIFMRIYNNDGSEVSACGNGTRAIGWYMMQQMQTNQVSIDTAAGVLYANAAGPMRVSVDMGIPGLDWTQIPLSERMDTIRMELQVGPIDNPILWGPSAVSMGNPHCVFFVENAETAPVTQVGPMIENHPLFPERTNVGFAQVIDKETIRLRVWERGAGLTLACGTGACAAMVAASRKRLIGRHAKMILDGGSLDILWREDDHVIMTGAVELEKKGKVAFR